MRIRERTCTTWRSRRRAIRCGIAARGGDESATTHRMGAIRLFRHPKMSSDDAANIMMRRRRRL
jgi:hypothetical protein